MSRRCPRSTRSTRSSTSSRLLLLHCRSEALVAVGVPLGSLLHGVSPGPALPWRPRLLHTLVQAVLALKGEGTDLLSSSFWKKGHCNSYIYDSSISDREIDNDGLDVDGDHAVS